MEAAANWIAPLTTTLAAVMVALNAGTRITGFGFVVFSIGSIAWAYIGWSNGQMNLVWQNIILLVVNLIGIWRWLGVRARYEQGAAVAAEQSV